MWRRTFGKEIPKATSKYAPNPGVLSEHVKQNSPHHLLRIKKYRAVKINSWVDKRGRIQYMDSKHYINKTNRIMSKA